VLRHETAKSGIAVQLGVLHVFLASVLQANTRQSVNKKVANTPKYACSAIKYCAQHKFRLHAALTDR